MKNRNNRAQSWMNAITFAEAGEWETAISLIPPPVRSKLAHFLELTFMAVAFAEEGLHTEARFLTERKNQPAARINGFLTSIGLQNAKFTYGILKESAVC